MERLKNISKKLDTSIKVTLRVAIIATAVMVFLMIASSIAYLIYPGGLDEGGRIMIGDVCIELSSDVNLGHGFGLKRGWFLMMTIVLLLVPTYYICTLARRILRPMKEGAPFDESVAHNIKKMGIAFLICGIGSNLLSMLQTLYECRVFERIAVTEGGLIRAVTTNYTVDLSFLWIFFIFRLIAHIFAYGAKLQQLSDETL